MRFAILIPVNNESAVIERKIRNTHRLVYPPVAHAEPHVAIVIDDYSSDDTYERAKAAMSAQPPRADLEWRLVRNTREAGKGNALRAGFEEAAGFDIFIISDADAVISARAPVATARAFMNPRVGAATGVQRYVERLDAEQIVGNRLDLYDYASESVRLLESRFGMLWSVHGPWLALRASAGVRPMRGVAADDLDLSLQLRKRGWRVVALPDAPFYEVKPAGTDLWNQQIRRARAWFEAMDGHFANCLQFSPRGAGALQYLLYAIAPPALAIGFYMFIVILPFFIFSQTGSAAFFCCIVMALAGLLQLPPMSDFERYARVILLARFSPKRDRADRWAPFSRTA